MRKLVVVMGGLEWIEIKEAEEVLRMDVRYIGTDFEEEVDIYEDCFTGKLLGIIN